MPKSNPEMSGYLLAWLTRHIFAADLRSLPDPSIARQEKGLFQEVVHRAA
jgi:hypothetical protein